MQVPEQAKPRRKPGQAKTGAERVAKLRDGFEAKGVKRFELSPPPHLDDRLEIKALAENLARRRANVPA